MMLVFIIRGAAMGLLFAPLVAMTMSTIPEEKFSHATGLFSVQRQIGAALGVALFETIFAFRQVFHTTTIGSAVDTSSPAFTAIQDRLEASVINRIGASVMNAALYAQEIIVATIKKQVFIQAIDDSILVAGIITFFSCIPLFFLRKKI